PESCTAFANAPPCCSCSSREDIGGSNRYAACAPLKALVSATASPRSAVNASAPLRTKRCNRPASRPTTRTFRPFDSRKSATIEPVFPLAPKITYVVFESTVELIAMTSWFDLLFFLTAQLKAQKTEWPVENHCLAWRISPVKLARVIRAREFWKLCCAFF